MPTTRIFLHVGLTLTNLLVVYPERVEGQGGVDRSIRTAYERAQERIAQAQANKDVEAVNRLAAEAATLLGRDAGMPDIPNTYRIAPASVPRLSGDEILHALDTYWKEFPQRRWWKIDLQPTKLTGYPHEVADAIRTMVVLHRGNFYHAEQALKEAREAGDFLLWSQSQVGKGLIPIPGGVVRSQVALRTTQIWHRSENGLLQPVIHEGWIVGDTDHSLIQREHAEAALALAELFIATGDEKYRTGARWGGRWALKQAALPNWHQNVATVAMLARVYRISGEKVYLDAAIERLHLGVYPGQIRSGRNAGRWADPENARPGPHYLLVHGLASVLAVLPPDHAEVPVLLSALSLAVKARNSDLISRGLIDREAALEAMLELEQLRRTAAWKQSLADCFIPESLELLERYAISEHRKGRPCITPRLWAQLLVHVLESRR